MMTRKEADQLDVHVYEMLEAHEEYLTHPNNETDSAYVAAVADYSRYWNEITEDENDDAGRS